MFSDWSIYLLVEGRLKVPLLVKIKENISLKTQIEDKIDPYLKFYVNVGSSTFNHTNNYAHHIFFQNV